MSKSLRLIALAILLSACNREKLEPVSKGDAARVNARVFNFQVYPGATYLEPYTDLLKKAHFVLQPNAKEAPPMAVYDTADAVDKVAPWYADKYSYPTIADNFSSVPPPAYYTQGEIQADLANLKPVLEKLGMSTDLTTGVGKYRGAYIRPQETLPRVSIQRPYFDLVNHKLVDRTLIVMVREGQ